MSLGRYSSSDILINDLFTGVIRPPEPLRTGSRMSRLRESRFNDLGDFSLAAQA